VLRGGKVVVRSSPLQHFFDCPLQFGAFPEHVEATDSADNAEIFNLPVQLGDVIIAGQCRRGVGGTLLVPPCHCCCCCDKQGDPTCPCLTLLVTVAAAVLTAAAAAGCASFLLSACCGCPEVPATAAAATADCCCDCCWVCVCLQARMACGTMPMSMKF
jgi:hypothetical protein